MKPAIRPILAVENQTLREREKEEKREGRERAQRERKREAKNREIIVVIYTHTLSLPLPSSLPPSLPLSPLSLSLIVPNKEAESNSRYHIHCQINKYQEWIALREHSRILQYSVCIYVTMATMGVANPKQESHNDGGDEVEEELLGKPGRP